MAFTSVILAFEIVGPAVVKSMSADGGGSGVVVHGPHGLVLNTVMSWNARSPPRDAADAVRGCRSDGRDSTRILAVIPPAAADAGPPFAGCARS